MIKQFKETLAGIVLPKASKIIIASAEKAQRVDELLTYSDYTDAMGGVNLTTYADFMETYSRSVWVYACIYEIANGVANAPLKVYWTDKDGNTYEIQDGTLVDLLKSVNPFYSQHTLIEGTMVHLESTGNCYWELTTENGAVPTIDNPPVELYFLSPDRIVIVPDANKYISHYVYSANELEIPIEADRVIHYKYFNPNSEYYGQGPVQALVHTLLMEFESQKYGKNFFKNNAQLSGILETDKTLNDTAFARIKAQWDKRYKGSDNAYKTAVLDSGLKWKGVSLSPKEAAFLEARAYNKKEIIAAFGMYPILLGEDTQNYAQAYVQERLFWSKTLLPKIRKIEETLNEKLLPFFYAKDANVSIRFDLSNIPSLVEGEVQKVEKARTLFQMGAISPNEVRVMLGMDSVNDSAANSLYIPLNLQAVGKVNIQKPKTPQKVIRGTDSTRYKDLVKNMEKRILKPVIKTEKKMLESGIEGSVYLPPKE